MITRLISGISLLGWLIVGLVVFDHNLAPRGTSTLYWTNLTQPSPVFHWTTRPRIREHQVFLPAGQRLDFSVTLPRGFTTGTVTVSALVGSQQLLLSADTSAGNKPAKVRSREALTKLEITWSQLIARDHTFLFHLEAVDPEQYGIALRSVTIFLKR